MWQQIHMFTTSDYYINKTLINLCMCLCVYVCVNVCVYVCECVCVCECGTGYLTHEQLINFRIIIYNITRKFADGINLC